MIGGVHRLEHGAGGPDEVELDLLALAGPQQAVVDEDAGQLIAHRPLHEGRGDRRVDSAGERADHPVAADLGADLLDLLVDDAGAGPGRTAARDVVEEVLQHPLAVLGVQHLRVPLDAGQPALDRLEGGDRGPRRAGGDQEALWSGGHLVPM